MPHRFKLLGLGTVIALVMCLFSCTTRNKAVAWMSVHPEVLTELCASKFPPKVNYIKGDTLHYETIVTVKGDSIPCPEVKDKQGRIYIPKVKCPDVTYKIDSVVIHDTLTIENTARVEQLTFAMSDLSDENDRLLNHRKKLIQLLVIASVLGGGAALWVFRR